MKRITIRISEELDEALRAAATETGVSVAEFARSCFEAKVGGEEERTVLGVTLPKEVWEELRACRSARPYPSKILVIRTVREHLHIGLREAKGIIDAVWDTTLL